MKFITFIIVLSFWIFQIMKSIQQPINKKVIEFKQIALNANNYQQSSDKTKIISNANYTVFSNSMGFNIMNNDNIFTNNNPFRNFPIQERAVDFALVENFLIVATGQKRLILGDLSTNLSKIQSLHQAESIPIRMIKGISHGAQIVFVLQIDFRNKIQFEIIAFHKKEISFIRAGNEITPPLISDNNLDDFELMKDIDIGTSQLLVVQINKIIAFECLIQELNQVKIKEIYAQELEMNCVNEIKSHNDILAVICNKKEFAPKIKIQRKKPMKFDLEMICEIDLSYHKIESGFKSKFLSETSEKTSKENQLMFAIVSENNDFTIIFSIYLLQYRQFIGKCIKSFEGAIVSSEILLAKTIDFELITYSKEAVQRKEKKENSKIQNKRYFVLITDQLQNLKQTAFCLPNEIMHNKLCTKCEIGRIINEGKCSQCPIYFSDDLLKSIQILENCYYEKCSIPNIGGPNCQSCDNFLKSINLPYSNSIQSFDQNNDLKPNAKYPIIQQCVPKCQESSTIFKSGECLSPELAMMIEDPCTMILDCQNCSMSETCIFDNKKCRKITAMDESLLKSLQKKEKQFYKSQICKPIGLCKDHDDIYKDNKQAKFILNSNETSQEVRKNQICKFTLELNDSAWLKVRTRETVTFFAIQNQIDMEIFMCQSSNSTIPANCQMINLQTNQEIKILAIFIQFFVLFRNNTQIVPNQFAITIEDGTFSDAFIITNWIMTGFILLTSIVLMIMMFRVIARTLRNLRHDDDFDEFGDHEEIQPNSEQVVESRINDLTANNRVIRIFQNSNVNQEFEQRQCHICMENFQNNEPIAKMLCNHMIHFACFRQWLRFQGNELKCPICLHVLWNIGDEEL